MGNRRCEPTDRRHALGRQGALLGLLAYLHSPISRSTAPLIRPSSGSAVCGTSSQKLSGSSRPMRSMTLATRATGRVMRQPSHQPTGARATTARQAPISAG